MNIERLVEDPNFSVVLPGPCNGRCAFCFWRQRDDEDVEAVLQAFARFTAEAPSEFRRLSITGGEPAFSPALESFLDAIDRQRWTTVVLTTTAPPLAIGLPMDAIKGKVDHVNISRHAPDDQRNNSIFGATMPTAEHIGECVAALNRHGVDVTINCVLEDNSAQARGHCLDMLVFAREVRAQAVCFRFDCATFQRELYPVEREFPGVAKEFGCPVCRTRMQFIGGLPVYWKAGAAEPNLEDSSAVTELILQSNGRITYDWAGSVPLEGGGMAKQEGWECPKCGRVYAPWMPECAKCSPAKEPATSGFQMKQAPPRSESVNSGFVCRAKGRGGC